MLKKLLGSRTRVSVLKLFIFNPKAEYFVREISRLAREPFDPVRKELLHLESIGLLKSRMSGKQKYYSVNNSHILFPEFKSLILKTAGLGDILRDRIKNRGDIADAFIYGSYAKNSENTESDIDLFIIGDVSSKELQSIVSEVENRSGREINHTIYSPGELINKYKAKNHFVLSVLKGPKIFLKGDESGLRELVRTG